MKGSSANRSPAWPEGVLRSPANGEPLVADGPHTLSDGRERWPVVEGIPYLRVGREDLRRYVVAALERGEEREALVELLRDQDDWAPDPPPERETISSMLDRDGAGPNGQRPNLREAMESLGFGPVGDYFAYRPSDPTYLAGLALLATGWNAPETSFELACGIGHYSRELAQRGVKTSAGDVVFAKLWLARRYVTPETRLVCFDASAPFPISDGRADLALCQDALYFLPEKRHVAEELLRITGQENGDTDDGKGAVVIGHAHNAAAENFSSGAPLIASEYAALLPSPTLYDDAELTECLVSKNPPTPRRPEELSGSEAICLTHGPKKASSPDFSMPPSGTSLRPNPLYEKSGGNPASFRLAWPSERYAEEYGPRSTYLPEEVEISRAALERAAKGGLDAEIAALARQRVLLDLPEGLR